MFVIAYLRTAFIGRPATAAGAFLGDGALLDVSRRCAGVTLF